MSEQPKRWSIDVGEFSDYLVGRECATKFRLAYLQRLASDAWWESPDETVYLDFSRVETVSPTWVNELLGHYAGQRSAEQIRRKIQVEHISSVKKGIFELELDELVPGGGE